MNKNERFDIVPIEEYDGLGANVIKMMLANTFTFNSLIKLKENVSEETMNQVPIFKNVKDFMEILEKEDGIKLTEIGDSSFRYAKKAYEKAEIKKYIIEKMGYKIDSEKENKIAELGIILIEMCEFTIVENNRISLTKLGEDALKNKENLFINIIRSFTKYNWSYLDGHKGDLKLNELVSYYYYLLGNYGDGNHEFDFYFDKIIEAFPALYELESIKRLTKNKEEHLKKLIYSRVFKGYMELLGLIECMEEANYKEIKRKEVFSNIIDISTVQRVQLSNKQEMQKLGIGGSIVGRINY